MTLERFAIGAFESSAIFKRLSALTRTLFVQSWRKKLTIAICFISCIFLAPTMAATTTGVLPDESVDGHLPSHLIDILVDLANPAERGVQEITELLTKLASSRKYFEQPVDQGIWYPSGIDGIDQIRIYITSRSRKTIDVWVRLSEGICVSNQEWSTRLEKRYGISAQKNRGNKDTSLGWVTRSEEPDWGSVVMFVVKPSPFLVISYAVHSEKSTACIHGPSFSYLTKEN